MSRPDRSLEQAWGAGAPIEPLAAVQEAASAFERGELPRPPVLALLAKALRLCLDGERDLWRALGIRVRRGGRHETPGAVRMRAAQADAVAAALPQMPGSSQGDKARSLELALSGSQAESGMSLSPTQSAAVAEARSAGVGSVKARALLRLAARAGVSSK